MGSADKKAANILHDEHTITNLHVIPLHVMRLRASLWCFLIQRGLFYFLRTQNHTSVGRKPLIYHKMEHRITNFHVIPSHVIILRASLWLSHTKWFILPTVNTISHHRSCHFLVLSTATAAVHDHLHTILHVCNCFINDGDWIIQQSTANTQRELCIGLLLNAIRQSLLCEGISNIMKQIFDGIFLSDHVAR